MASDTPGIAFTVSVFLEVAIDLTVVVHLVDGAEASVLDLAFDGVS